MLIYFLRHAEAEDSATVDFERRLTPKGVEQAERIGWLCASAGLMPQSLITSPVVRARQTAEIVAKILGNLPISKHRWLACGMTPANCFDGLKSLNPRDSVMLVGHEPDFSEVLGALLGTESGDALHIRKASLAAVDVSSLSHGGGCLEFLLPVGLLKQIQKQ